MLGQRREAEKKEIACQHSDHAPRSVQRSEPSGVSIVPITREARWLEGTYLPCGPRVLLPVGN